MVSLKKVEDRPTPPEVYSWKIYGLAAIAAIAAVCIGYDSAFVGGAIVLKGFTKDFGTLDANTSGNLVSTYQAGAFVGAFAGLPLGHFLGRRWGLTIAAIFFTIGAIIMTIASGSTGLAPIYAGRALAGIAIGAASNLTPIYISEISPPAIRGQLVGMYELGWQIGGIVGFFINYGVSINIAPSTLQWRIPFAVQIIPGGLLALTAPFLIESPRWLITRGRREESVRNLSKIRKLDVNHPYLVEELAEMNAAHDKQMALLGSNSFWAPFRHTFCVPKVLYRLAIGSSLFAFQNGTGINAINYFSPTVFKSLGITGSNTGLLTTGIFGVIKTLGAVVWILFLIDHFGRRRILMTGATGGAFAMLAIAIYIAVDKPYLRPAGAGLDSTGRFAIACFYIWTIFYGATWNGTPWVVGSEIFPQQSRTLGMALMAASNWGFNLVIARCTPLAFIWSKWGLYLIFACFMFISIPYIFFLLPETKGIPLEHMDELFDMPQPRKAGPLLLQELRQHQAHLGADINAHNRGANVDALSRDQKHNTSGSVTPENKEKREDIDVETGSADRRDYNY